MRPCVYVRLCCLCRCVCVFVRGCVCVAVCRAAMSYSTLNFFSFYREHTQEKLDRERWSTIFLSLLARAGIGRASII